MRIATRKLDLSMNAMAQRQRDESDRLLQSIAQRHAEVTANKQAEAETILASLPSLIEKAFKGLEEASYPVGPRISDYSVVAHTKERGIAPKIGDHVGHMRQFRTEEQVTLPPRWFRRIPKTVVRRTPQYVGCWYVGKVGHSGDMDYQNAHSSEWARFYLVPDLNALFFYRQSPSHARFEGPHPALWPQAFKPGEVVYSEDRHSADVFAEVQRTQWSIEELRYLQQLLKAFNPASWKE
jgi:hypothetical protein